MLVPEAPNQRWSMDFRHDLLANGQRFHSLNIVGEISRERPAIEVDTSLPAVRVVFVLDRHAEIRGLPLGIIVDNGLVLAGKALVEWAWRNPVRLNFIDSGKPTQNAFIEPFNGRFRDECLYETWFLDPGDARETIETWRIDNNTGRPHSALGYTTPEVFASSLQRHALGEMTTSAKAGQTQQPEPSI